MRKVLVAGASGFIGHALIERLLQDESLEIVGLSRSQLNSSHPRLSWKKCDLYSLKDISQAMDGCTEAYYLVHSMLPSATLSQGAFYNYDLIMADNFVRAAIKHHIEHIIYLGGMIPPFGELSWHLRSRLEVEQTFTSSKIKTTVLRAGLIVGANGSSFTILERLIRRLPIMICPDWTETNSQPVALRDVINVLVRSLKEPSLQGQVYDVGGPEIVTYQGLIAKTAKKIKKDSKLISLSIIPLWFSRFWVSFIAGVPRNLVYPLVLSLKHEMVANVDQSWPHAEDLSITLDEALDIAFAETKPSAYKAYTPVQRDVRSVQRLVLPEGRNAEWMAQDYFNWLPTFFSTVVKAEVVGDRVTFVLFNPKIKILILHKSVERSSPDRQLMYVIGGLLSAKQDRGRLEFREVLDRRYVIAALHEFRPSLPWYLYVWTQAIVHLITMRAFDEHLKWLVISQKRFKS